LNTLSKVSFKSSIFEGRLHTLQNNSEGKIKNPLTLIISSLIINACSSVKSA